MNENQQKELANVLDQMGIKTIITYPYYPHTKGEYGIEVHYLNGKYEELTIKGTLYDKED